MVQAIKKILVKSLDNGKKKQKTKLNYPKHRKIDRSMGTDYSITYGGMTVKITEFKIKTSKARIVKIIEMTLKKFEIFYLSVFAKAKTKVIPRGR